MPPQKRRYWLMKSEPSVFSYDDLVKEPDSTAMWDGVRNYQARNLLRDEIRVGDRVLFYHSNDAPIGVVGVCRVVRAGYPDPTQFDSKQKYYDPKSSKEKPRWYVVDVKAQKKLPRIVTLSEIKEDEELTNMKLVQKGQRLSVQPVTEMEFDRIVAMSKR
ncbi:MAG: EVE domain-containing protein [Myxococcota bacterium]